MILPKSKHSAREELLRSMFDDDELRALIRRLPEADELVAGLPGVTASSLKVVSETIALLDRRGLIDLDLFETLADERPRKRSAIAEVASSWGVALSNTIVTSQPDAPWRTLAVPPSFLRPDERASQSGLRLIGISVDQPTRAAEHRAFRFTLKNETSEHLTLVGLTVEATLLAQVALLSTARLLEPADCWDIEFPIAGGTMRWLSSVPIELSPGRSSVIAVRFYVKDGDALLPPSFCGSYDLRVTFETGEGASAASELIPCGAQPRRLRRP